MWQLAAASAWPLRPMSELACCWKFLCKAPNPGYQAPRSLGRLRQLRSSLFEGHTILLNNCLAGRRP